MQTFIVYAHLIAVCVAVGVLLTQDFALMKTRGRPLSKQESNELRRSAEIIAVALIALWVTGAALVINGYINDPAYLLNQKIWAKLCVVAILTLNGLFLHHFSFPRVVSSRGMFGLGNRDKVLVVLSGVISTASWLFACYLGIARQWNHTVGLGFIMLVYACLIIPACISGSGVALLLKPYKPCDHKRPGETRVIRPDAASLSEHPSGT